MKNNICLKNKTPIYVYEKKSWSYVNFCGNGSSAKLVFTTTVSDAKLFVGGVCNQYFCISLYTPPLCYSRDIYSVWLGITVRVDGEVINPRGSPAEDFDSWDNNYPRQVMIHVALNIFNYILRGFKRI